MSVLLAGGYTESTQTVTQRGRPHDILYGQRCRVLHVDTRLSAAMDMFHTLTALTHMFPYLHFIFTALHEMQTRSSDENSVRLSVRLSVRRVICNKIEERSVQIFIPYERTFSLVF